MVSSSLKEFILNSEKIDLYNYYEDYIKPLDERFQQYSYYEDRLVLCFFKDHEDINPSMGSIADRKHKGKHLCHCFGCGKTADVIRVHQIIENQYHNRTLSEKDACIELAKLYQLDIDDITVDEEDDIERKDLQRQRRIEALSKSYTVRDFAQNLANIRHGKMSLERINRESVKMIATVKQLY